MKKNILLLLIVLFPAFLHAQTLTLNPSTFTADNLNSVSSGTIVYLEPGVYTPNQTVLNVWSGCVGGRNNITFKPSGTGDVIIDGMQFPEQVEVQFINSTNLLIQGITVKNIKLTLWQCNNSTLDHITSKEQKFILPAGTTEDTYGKELSLLGIGYGNNCTISNCNLEITFSKFSCKAIKSYRGTNHKFINNTIKGNLMGAYEIWSNVGQVKDGLPGYSGALVKGGYIERTVLGGNEDHGIYYHDVSHAKIDSVTIKGWSVTAAGGAVKIKNADDVEIVGCTFYTSGVLLRTGSEGWQHCSNIYIHHNDIHGGMALSTYMTPNAGYDNPEAIVFEQNKLFDDGITMKYDVAKFNQYSTCAEKYGGIYNNEYNGILDVASEVNGIISNCTFGNGCASGAAGAPKSGSAPSTKLNLALNNSVTFSSQQVDDVYNNPAVNAVDGDTSTYWAAQSFPQWLEVDLGAEVMFNKIEVVCYMDRAYQFTVEAKDPATGQYKSIVYRTRNTQYGSASNPISNLFDYIKARYVKITVSGCYDYTGDLVGLTEFRIIDTMRTITGVLDEHIIPSSFTLRNYPNPFNPSTVINYQITQAGNVNLSIYDINGRLVETAVNDFKQPGTYEYRWNASRVNAGIHIASGVYFARLQSGGNIKTIKMMLLK